MDTEVSVPYPVFLATFKCVVCGGVHIIPARYGLNTKPPISRAVWSQCCKRPNIQLLVGIEKVDTPTWEQVKTLYGQQQNHDGAYAQLTLPEVLA